MLVCWQIMGNAKSISGNRKGNPANLLAKVREHIQDTSSVVREEVFHAKVLDHEPTGRLRGHSGALVLTHDQVWFCTLSKSKEDIFIPLNWILTVEAKDNFNTSSTKNKAFDDVLVVTYQDASTTNSGHYSVLAIHVKEAAKWAMDLEETIQKQ